MSSRFCIIPARGGSKGIRKKNIAILGTMPLMHYSIATGRKFFDEVYVSTDDEDIKVMAVALGAKFITRPKEFATDSATDYGWLDHAFTYLKCSEICVLRPTTPLRDEKIIENAIKYWDANKEYCDSMRSAHLVAEPPNKFVRKDVEGFCPTWQAFTGNLEDLDKPRQSFAHVYKPNGYIDFVKAETIKNGSIYGKKILAFETPVAVEVDTPEELEYLNFKFAKND